MRSGQIIPTNFIQLSCFLDTSSSSVSGLGHKKVHAPNMEEKYKETHCSHYNNPQTNRKQHPTSYWRYNATDRTKLDYPYHVGSSLSSGQMIDSSPTFVRNKKKHAAIPARRGTTWNKTKGLNGNNAKILHICQCMIPIMQTSLQGRHNSILVYPSSHVRNVTCVFRDNHGQPWTPCMFNCFGMNIPKKNVPRESS